MATHSSILAWRIPWTEKPGGLQSIGSQRVGHDWSDLACMDMEHRWTVYLSPTVHGDVMGRNISVLQGKKKKKTRRVKDKM